MKRIIPILFILSLFLSTSCSQQNSLERTSLSPDGNMQIVVYGHKNSPLDPWRTYIVVEGGGIKDSAHTQIFAKELSENIDFEWIDDTTCKVTFSQQDNSHRTLKVSLKNNIFRVYE